MKEKEEFKPWSLKQEDILKKLNTEKKGLTEKEASLRLNKYGKNEIKEVYKISPVKIFLKQFKSFLVYILFVAIIISLIIKHYIDASAILAIVILNSFLGFFQQYKAEKSIVKLKKMLKPESKVYRDGKLKIISSENLVPGDIIKLEEGDKVTADCRILEVDNLETNEAVLTGESLPIQKQTEKIKGKTVLAERKDMLYSGTSVVKGNCKAVVISTGMKTEFGKIATHLQKIKIPETPMQKKLDKFAKQISIIIIFLSILTLIFGIITGKDNIEMFLTAVSLAVSAIPEGLPAIITLSLAFAVNSMAEKKVIVRRLPAAESLGSVTVICSDKTGTITEEKMAVREIYTAGKLYKKKDNKLNFKNKKININKEKELYQLMKTSVLCNNARFEKQENKIQAIGDPTESALVMSALDLGVNKKVLTEQEQKIKEFSFTSERRLMSVLRKGERRNILYAKGAPEKIIRKSKYEFKRDSVKLDEKRKKHLIEQAEQLEKKGYRVLAFAFKYSKENSNKVKEEDFIFLGFMALLDPPRKEVKLAIEKCRQAGIKIKIITGDSALTAKAVAKEIGITGEIVTGTQLEEMKDKELSEKIDKIEIFARTSPTQKLRIVQILKLKKEEVAITGDGVNDVLALKKADIGIAMGKRGSDVAREISGMVLVDDNFASIVEAVEEGRIIYDNSKKATKFLISLNFVEIFLIGYSILMRLPLPLLPLQILWINLITDSLPALALTKEKGEDVMNGKPRKEPSIITGVFFFVLIASLVSLVVEILIFQYGLENLSIEKTRTMVLMTVIGFTSLFVFTCRSNKSLLKTGFFTNKWLLFSIIAIVLLQAILLYTPLAPVFGVVPLTGKEWSFVFLASLPGIILFESYKLIKRNKK